MTAELSEFLLARIAEDEAVARRAAKVPDRVRVPDDARDLRDFPPTGEGQWGWGGGPFRASDEDPAVVAALGLTDSDAPYHVSACEARDEGEPTGGRYDVAVVPTDHDAAQHIARHDPARVLARCAADRQLVQLHFEEVPEAEIDPELGPKIPCCTEDWSEYPCPTLRLLALPYADHDDYREEWRP